MRPFPMLVRVSLFAVGFGLGVSHIKPQPTLPPIVLELHLSKKDMQAVMKTSARCYTKPPMQNASVTNW
jgi:hypothetical protein